MNGFVRAWHVQTALVFQLKLLDFNEHPKIALGLRDKHKPLREPKSVTNYTIFVVHELEVYGTCAGK